MKALVFLVVLIASSDAIAQHTLERPLGGRTEQTASKPVPSPTPKRAALIAKWRQDWQPFAHTVDLSFYYRPASVARSTAESMTAWTRIIPRDLAATRKEQIKSIAVNDKELATKFRDYAYDLNLIEIRCSSREFRLLEYFAYSSNGQVLDRAKTSNQEWVAIVPHSAMDYLREEVCDPLGIDAYLNSRSSGVSPEVAKLREISQQAKADAQRKVRRTSRMKKPTPKK